MQEVASDFRTLFRELINDSFSQSKLTNNSFQEREVLSVFWYRFSLFFFNIDRICCVTVTTEKCEHKGFHFASCKSKFAVLKRCYSIERKVSKQ